ncbi:probable polyribonucleotide nucleotidyltransferase 1, chloroplastic [Hordeum vulgare subsp. vulgare]|uniref:polyribonucleotide nucleotidyltransferase n=1 Tax=Hordeum vulgare subsp. vulgare TaxID=112509 RepID=F2DF72_HORVV|nr:probable polyribonucleotide nucleotidyltransferase 1, chloroplastic [Hordeum vulgare subsp. vulgare]KAI5013458.1 hypothetical protein ZWY2020_034570 [Hordeum vulgare]BAJ93743.1 predicted protein [Hordeum vulgare subsp. vulgare]
MLASPTTLHHLLLPAPPHLAFVLPHTAPPLHAWLPLSRVAPPRVAALTHGSSRRMRRRGARDKVVAAVGHEAVPAVAAEEASSSGPTKFSVKIPVGDRHILVETGHIGRQASGSVMVTDGETIVYCSVCMADTPSDPSDFFPMSVHYQERLSAAGRTSGGFFKREGRAKDHEVLVCRLIDRPLRPTMPKGFYYETQILSWVFSYDGLHSPDCVAVTAAGIAMALSEVPNKQTIAGVRIGMINDQFVVNPTTEQMEDSELDLMMAGTDSAILMIEGFCNFLTEEKLLQAVETGQAAIREICKAIDVLVQTCGKKKMVEAINLPPTELYRHVEDLSGEELVKALQIKEKILRRKALSALEEKVIMILSEQGYVSKDELSGTIENLADIVEEEDEDEVIEDGEVDEGDVHIKPVSRKPRRQLFSEVDVKLVFKEVSSKYLRRRIVEGEKRSDGRSACELRPINSQCGILPRAHGSALFTRGETQALAVVTLGDYQMAQRIDTLVDTEESKSFYLQYTFPPSSVGEVGRTGAPNRREIGHGMLAERALEPILPPEVDFPYTIRVESTITESNGSSSMASVCGGCLALQDAGVPIKFPVAGIAMGLVLDTHEFGGDGTPLILSDITGSEDASGDMDFKVAGNEHGISAFQMDIKVVGITLPVMEQALLQARDGRNHILNEMLKCSPPPSKALSPHAPVIHVMKVKPNKVNLIIGSGGRTIKSILEETGVYAIDARDDGTVKITARDMKSLEKSKNIITNLTMVPKVGEIFRNCEIKTVAPYGAFVEIAPGREGLCHISELSSSWLAKAEDAYKVGDRIDVKLIEINDKGQLRLSCKALLPDSNQEPSSIKQQTSSSVKEKVVYKDDIIKMTTRRSRRKKEVEPSAAENATPKTLENSTADSA